MMKYLLHTLLFFIASSFLFAQDVEKPQKPKKLLKNAEKYMKSGDVYSAIDNYVDYVDMIEDDYVIAYRLGEAYLLARDYKNAEKTFKRIFDADPDNYRKAQYFHSICMMHTATTDIDKRYSDMEQGERETLFQEAIGKYEEAKKSLKVFSKKYRGSDKSEYKKKVKMQMLGCDLAIRKLSKPEPMIKEHLDTNINRAYTDMSPLPVGKNKLIFSSMRSDTIVYVDTKDTEAEPFTAKLYVAVKEDSSWKFKGEFDNVFNEPEMYVGNGVFSRDKSRFYYSKCQENDEGRILCDIWFSEKDSGKWQEPQALSTNVNTKKYTETQPAIGYDPRKKREVLYFVSDREEGSRGGFDIWYTYFDKKKTNDWVTPLNCKTKINSIGNEMTPSYDMESNTMYFSSDFWPGMGGLDVFKSQGGMKRWSGKPVNIGFPLNSGADDLYYVLDQSGESGYFSSNRTGGYALKNPTCCDDIYYFRWLNLIRVFTEGIVVDEADETETPLRDAVVSLYLEDPETGEEVLIKTDTTIET
ncbi:MAG TPA: hypothetical protein EYQ86_03820, partial [Bacteroidetes bacterium]|nr:hypothetical protein [Bacteroidota bacterium]